MCTGLISPIIPIKDLFKLFPYNSQCTGLHIKIIKGKKDADKR